MSSNIGAREFLHTAVTGHGIFFPKIARTGCERQHHSGINVGGVPKPPVAAHSSSVKSKFSASRQPMEWDFTYRAKPKRKPNKPQCNGVAGASAKDNGELIRRACTEEGACRQLLVANEAIERQRLLRLLDGVYGNKIIPIMEAEKRGMRLLSQREYVSAYVCFTRIINQNPNAKIALCKRALCDWHLLLFDECVDDCRKALDADPDLLTLLCRSLVVRGRYQEARQWYDYGLTDLYPSIDEPHHIKWSAERAALPALESFRRHVEQKNWEDAVALIGAAKPLIDDTPLVVLEARALLRVSPPTARLRLTKYVPTIIRPSSVVVGMSPEEQAVWRNVNEHYLEAAIVLAQANVYCGSEHLAVAAALVQTCLSLSPGYGPGIVLGNYLVSLEEICSNVAELFEKGRYADAIPYINEGLHLDKSNRLMCAHLYCMRAEVHAHCGKYTRAVEDCSAAIGMCCNYAQAYVCRAEANEQLNNKLEAALDRLTAVRIDPTLRHILRGDEQSIPHVERSSPPNLQREKFETHWYDAFLNKSGFGSRQNGPAGEHYTRLASSQAITSAAPTLYDILELQPGASVDDVRAQFKKLTLQFHPDRVVREAPVKQVAALERFKLINKAHEVLANPEEKLIYDISIGVHARMRE
ncbi:putative TPR-repeat-containing chaperone protein DNAJ [Trypanosoma vivax]|nr:putative TPR-repeat-containing chaperone protein DNAJ [Trypanosoma vivax]